ncbi:MAG: RsmE family RNA methyltransferase [Trueperaceae bacterium]
MRVHRVRVEHVAAGRLRLAGDGGHHLARVLRVRPGAEVVAFDGRGSEAPGRVAEVDGDGVWLELDEPTSAATEPARSLTLAPALLKGDKLADVVRMGTELGVVAFRPVLARRCDVRELSPAKRARLQRVASEAARQSGRALVPTVHEAVAVGDLAWEVAAVVADLAASLPWRAAPGLGGDRLTVITGPEGGWSPDETTALEARGAARVRLGARVLRAETAPVAMAAAWLLAGEA